MIKRLNIIAKRVLRKALEKRGIILISRSRFKNTCFALARAVEEISNKQKNLYKPGLEGIVFTKDRPLQLHALLSSCFRLCANVPKLTVIYNASSVEFENAYKKVAKIFQDKQIVFVKEDGFRATFINSIRCVKTDKIFFLVDDIIFVRKVDFNFVADLGSKDSIVSLRLAPHLRYCYTSAAYQSVPKLFEQAYTPEKEKLFTWGWREGEYDWAYPLSVDGNIFQTNHIAIISQLVNYSAPNSFEVALQNFEDLYKKKKGICFEKSRIVNIPFNKVQTENNNISGNVSSADMLSFWLKGLEIDLDYYCDILNVSAHQEMKLYLRERV